MTRMRLTLAATLAVALGTLAPAGVFAGSSSGQALVPSTWSCTGALNGDEVFYLPAVAVSPGAGAFIAPFPGFLATNGRTYIVLAAGPIGSVSAVGQKVGLQSSVSDCISTDFGAEVLVAPAG